jgi:hypothetical protein
MEVVPPEDRPRRAGSGPRRTRVVVKKVGPWSVLRFSLLFYFCLMVAFWIGFILLYNFLQGIGVLDSIEHGIRNAGGKPWANWSFHAGWIFSRMFMIGLVMVVFGAVVNLFAAFIYNLIAEFVGGIELTLTERR